MATPPSPGDERLPPTSVIWHIRLVRDAPRSEGVRPERKYGCSVCGAFDAAVTSPSARRSKDLRSPLPLWTVCPAAHKFEAVGPLAKRSLPPTAGDYVRAAALYPGAGARNCSSCQTHGTGKRRLSLISELRFGGDSCAATMCWASLSVWRSCWPSQRLSNPNRPACRPCRRRWSGRRGLLDNGEQACRRHVRGTDSKVWFTVAKGITSEIFYPRLDIPNMQDMQYIITDGSTFVDLERDATSHVISMPTKTRSSTSSRIRTSAQRPSTGSPTPTSPTRAATLC